MAIVVTILVVALLAYAGLFLYTKIKDITNSEPRTSASELPYDIFVFDSELSIKPQDTKVERGSEDTGFKTNRTFGVIDGVGAWFMTNKIDAGIFARSLAKQIEKQVRTFKRKEVKPNALTRAVEKALARVTEKGSCTAVIVDISPYTGLLTAFSIGDATMLVLRPGKEKNFLTPENIVMQTESKSHSFNKPYTIGTTREYTSSSGEKKVSKADGPYDANTYTAKVQKGDIILLFSDGVSDNLYLENGQTQLPDHHGILEIVSEGLRAESNASQIATNITSRAYSASIDSYWYSPYRKNAKEENEQLFSLVGGKKDDITTLCIVVK